VFSDTLTVEIKSKGVESMTITSTGIIDLSKWAVLHDAVVRLSSVCDYANTNDGTGFNGVDAGFGHSLAEKSFDRWTPKMVKSTYKMVRKYRGQLAGFGIDFDSIPTPDFTDGDIEAHKTARVSAGRKTAVRTVVISGGDFILRFPYDPAVVSAVKSIPGARWNPSDKFWYFDKTRKDSILRFIEVAKEFSFEATDAVREASKVSLSVKKIVPEIEKPTLSLKTDGVGLDLYPFQIEGAKWLIEKEKAMLGWDMGTGKTPTSLVAMHSADAYPVLVVTTASMKYTWMEEIEKWLPNKTIKVLNGGKALGKYGDTDFTIINYDILTKHISPIEHAGFKGVILDESHKIKTRNAKRTRSALKIVKEIPYVFLLSGTPVMNRPVELVTQLQAMNGINHFGGVMKFIGRYCDPKVSRWGTDYSGASNLKELNTKLTSTVYNRITKAEALPDLPERTISVVPSNIDNRPEYNRIEANLISWLLENKGRDAANRASRAEHLVRINALKEASVKGKLGNIKLWIADFLESDEKLVVFSDSRIVQKALMETYPDALHILGSDNAKKKNDAKNAFQNDPNEKLIICSLKAASEGITLTAGSNALFVDLGWNPATHDQAESRLHRNTQKNAVNCYYILGKNTIDNFIWNLIEQKRKVVGAILDGVEGDLDVRMLDDVIDYLTSKD